MSALTRFVLRHKLLVLVAWLALAVAGAMTAASTTKRLTTSFAMPGAAFRTDARIQALYLHTGAQDPVVPVITLPSGTTIRTPGVAAKLDRAFAAARQVIPTARVTDYGTTHDPAFATNAGRSTYALVFAPQQDPMSPGATTARMQEAISGAVPSKWRVRTTGIQALATGKSASKGAGVLVESMLGGLGALVVLAFVFASFLALVPLVMAGISILTTFLALDGLTHLTQVSQVVEFLIALIGLGVAIDYSLLVVTRWREERAHGSANDQAVLAAMTSAGRAVLFSGLTVGIGLLALVVLPVPFLRSAGIGGVLIPLISVAVAVTLLPVILVTIGPRLDWPRIRTETTASPGWSAWARLTVRHRGLAAIAGTATLVALMLPSLSMHVGEPSTAALAQSGPAHASLRTLEAGGVPSGTLTPIDVLARQTAVPQITRKLADVPGVHAVISPITAQFRRHDTALITVLPTGYLEFARPTIREGLDRLAARGARSIRALPAMLFAASHVKNDLPWEINSFVADNPETEVRFGRDLAVDAKLLAAAADRIGSVIQKPREDAVLVVVGRGTNDPDANSNIAKIARMLWEGMGFGWAEAAFSGVAHPRVDAALDRAARLGFRRIVVFPYFLFTGVLVKRIYAQTDAAAARFPDIGLVKAPYLRDHPLVLDAFVERAAELDGNATGEAKMNCQFCKYRAQIIGYESEVGAPQEGHHHHVRGIGSDTDRHHHPHGHRDQRHHHD